MADRHKLTPVSFRPPAADRTWLYGYAQRSGHAVGELLREALALFRASKKDDQG